MPIIRYYSHLVLLTVYFYSPKAENGLLPMRRFLSGYSLGYSLSLRSNVYVLF